MEVREARWNELHEVFDLCGLSAEELFGARIFVAIADSGRICAVLPLRLTWFAEPLVANGNNKAESSRAAVLVYRAAEDYIASCQTPQMPPRGLFTTTRARHVKMWAKRLGWNRLFKGAALYVKHFPRR